MPLSPTKGGGINPEYYSTFWGDGEIIFGGLFFDDYKPSNQFHAVAWYQDSVKAAIGDEINWPVVMKAGTYDIHILGEANNDRGITEIFTGNTSVAFFDWYSGAYSIPNTLKSVLNVELPEGETIIKSVISGKDPGSTAYIMVGTRLYITKS